MASKNTSPDQLPLFPDETPQPQKPSPKTLKLDQKKLDLLRQKKETIIIEGIPRLTLPTRWEQLQPRLEGNEVSLRTIIKPVYEAINVIRDIIEYLRTTDGCQVLVIRADTGSGKTTFLNTLPHYMQDVEFSAQTIDLQTLDEEEFGKQLWNTFTSSDKLNLIILEGREKPESISDRYIQIVLANINRFARTRRVPMLIVIPTIEDQVARSWCEHGTRVGDLIPQQKLYGGSQWYNYPGVPKDKYIEIAEETVRTLNSPYSLVEFGVSADEIRSWVDTAPTIGRFMEILANRISDRRRGARLQLKGRKEHVWIVYCNPDVRHYDHTFLVLDGLVQDEKLRVSPPKLITNSADTTLAAHWRQGKQWNKLVNATNFLDVRLINMPIITTVTAALTYGSDKLLESFKHTSLAKYRDYLTEELGQLNIDWDQVLSERRLQVRNANDSMERTNLFRLLRGLAAEEQRGGNTDTPKLLAQYRHLRDHTSESELHLYIGQTLQALLEYHQFPGFVGVETETRFVPDEPSPVPDVVIHTETDIYALEFHFLRKQIVSSEMSRYALTKVIEKYIKGLSHLSSLLNSID
ncbi:MAG TPA: hypothetical protein VGD69_30530 [Herpetosiphonaceae bacterium]